MNSIGAIEELMPIGHTIILNAHPELLELALLDDLALSLRLNKDTFFTQANAPEVFPTTTKTSITMACDGEQCGTLTLIAHNFLRQHISAELQAVGRKGFQCQPTLFLLQAPMSVNRIVVPLPLQSQVFSIEVVSSLGQEC